MGYSPGCDGRMGPLPQEGALAQIKGPRKECDRCMKRTPAEKTETFTYDGTEYEVDLCGKHLLDLDRDFRKWTAVAREQEAPFGEVTRLGKELHESAVREADRQRTRIELDRDWDLPSGLPPVFSKWSMTNHAKQRRVQRGFSTEECMKAVLFPDNDTPIPGRLGYRKRTRGRVTAVVYPPSFAVVTVLHSDPEDFVKDNPPLDLEEKIHAPA